MTVHLESVRLQGMTRRKLTEIRASGWKLHEVTFLRGVSSESMCEPFLGGPCVRLTKGPDRLIVVPAVVVGICGSGRGARWCEQDMLLHRASPEQQLTICLVRVVVSEQRIVPQSDAASQQ